ncbi:glycosyltransferase family 4 protein [Paenibacillus alkalitolerans]|uniref:glycosyltransferase family 4 protein n=1 Tax=Paenibacillus alkalitolerans TaxID=2799335 RepID=UPI0018F56C8A|nr:glycosyltransferase family 1 protein [Paenibacillus alkalitolerans]
MRVAVDVVPIRSDGVVGGAHHFVMELLKGLFNKNRKDRFYLLTASGNHEYFAQFESHSIKRICVDSVPIRINRSKSMLSKYNIDVLFCPMSAITYAEPGIPSVSIIYDIQHEYYPQFFTLSELSHRKRFYQELCEKADAVICISKFTKDSILEKFQISRERINVVHIGIQERFNIDSLEHAMSILKRHSLANKVYGFYPANFWPHKNHRMLLVAFSMLLDKFPDLKLHLVFTGSLWNEKSVINDAIRQMKLQDRVHYLGYLSDAELSVVLSGASFVIFPSLFEGFGIPIAEAMTFGKPVLCSNTTSLPEVAGEAALYFDPRKPDSIMQSIEKILNDRDLQIVMVGKGFKQVQIFNRDKMIDSYYEVLEKVAKRRN